MRGRRQVYRRGTMTPQRSRVFDRIEGLGIDVHVSRLTRTLGRSVGWRIDADAFDRAPVELRFALVVCAVLR